MLPRRFETTASRAEFLRLLQEALGDEAFVGDGELLVGASGWRMRVTPLPPCSFGGVELERLRVEAEFPGWQEADADRFMQRFALFYQRGGG